MNDADSSSQDEPAPPEIKPIPIPAEPAIPDASQAANYPSPVAEDRGPATPPAADGGASQALTRLLVGYHPFITAFIKMETTSERHKVRAVIVFALEILFKIVIYAVLIGILVLVAWKTIAPVQPFWK